MPGFGGPPHSHLLQSAAAVATGKLFKGFQIVDGGCFAMPVIGVGLEAAGAFTQGEPVIHGGAADAKGLVRCDLAHTAVDGC